jgi:hypothetical protein
MQKKERSLDRNKVETDDLGTRQLDPESDTTELALVAATLRSEDMVAFPSSGGVACQFAVPAEQGDCATACGLA